MIDRYLGKLNNLGSSSVNCNITIGSIQGFFGKNCNINISNSCLNNESVINSLLLASLSEILNIIQEPELIQSIKSSLGISDINNLPTAIFQTECNSLALINNNINILQLNFSRCTATYPITLNFVNSGSALSVCGLSSILNAFILADNNIFENTTTANDNNYIIYIIIALFLVTSILLIFLHYKNKPTIIYTTNYIKKDHTNLSNLLKEMKKIHANFMKN
jgi:hypothetical protein